MSEITHRLPRYQALDTRYLSISRSPGKEGIIIPILEMRKASFGEVQTLLQANFGAIKWQTKLQTQSLSQHHN